MYIEVVLWQPFLDKIENSHNRRNTLTNMKIGGAALIEDVDIKLGSIEEYIKKDRSG